MGKTLEKKRKKKKAHPPHPQHLHNSHCGSSTPPPSHEEDVDEELLSDGGKRREKKLTLVLRLPHPTDDSDLAKDGNADPPLKKRHINALRLAGSSGDPSSDGSVLEKAGRRISLKAMDTLADGNSVRSTPLPDAKLLIFTLDRLQKKDTYGVFSEPVDPEELPDYHEVIEHPMDFGTIRNKLSIGAYKNLDEFESDVFLISSNAMHYNAPDTIYYRQARSIQELARKDFDNLRQPGGNKQEGKTARRGRPPGKVSIKRQLEQPAAERATIDFSDATLATSADGKSSSGYDLRRGNDKGGAAELYARSGYGSCDNEAYAWLGSDRKVERSEFSGMLKCFSRYARKQFIVNENRRNTYKQQLLQSIPTNLSLVPWTSDGEKKHLFPVGFHKEQAYARSLVQFAKNLGSVAWKVAARKILKALSPGTKFGPGWVGENDTTQQKPMAVQVPHHLETQTESCNISAREEQYSKLELKSAQSAATVPMAGSFFVAPSTQLDCIEMVEDRSKVVPYATGNPCRDMRIGSLQLYQGISVHQSLNDIISGSESGPVRDIERVGPGNTCASTFNCEASLHTPGSSSWADNMAASTSTKYGFDGSIGGISVLPNCSVTENQKIPTSCGILPLSCHDVLLTKRPEEQEQLFRQGFAPERQEEQIKHTSFPFPPDLNIRFQSPHSPASGGVVVGSQPPDLALQL